MKRSKQAIVAAIAILGLTAGGAAYAFRGDGHCAPQMMSKSPAEFAGNRLEKLHAELKLAPEQESAWKTWSDHVKQQAAGMKDRRAEQEEMRKLPAPERMEKMLGRMKEHQQKMESGLTAMRSFYATLTPEQQQAFDRFQPFGGRGERGGKPGGNRGEQPSERPGRG
ncbi:MAG: periplasmic protein CpxP/Spy [Pseudomonadota bacterium]|nr:periplasmic protein CpxP/Spy [Pseudomonadota bacterium]MDQ5918328.1 periplasmic protein CpxP/Spy [Pseudomonadota bacterium]MDQ5947233.1 periplasmic protein CpxP/Spy [Pseudomonadota bacterium]